MLDISKLMNDTYTYESLFLRVSLHLLVLLLRESLLLEIILHLLVLCYCYIRESFFLRSTLHLLVLPSKPMNHFS